MFESFRCEHFGRAARYSQCNTNSNHFEEQTTKRNNDFLVGFRCAAHLFRLTKMC